MTTTEIPENHESRPLLGLGLSEGLGPLVETAWTLAETLSKRETTHRAYLWFTNPQNSAWSALYALTPEDVLAVNADRKHRAWQALRRLDLCRCDHHEYCRHCHPLEFRPGGVWGGPNARLTAPDTALQEQR